MKAVIDTGTMITLSSTCLMNVFKEFVRFNKIELLVSSSVAEESVWKPITNKRFALNAARIKRVFNEKVVNVVTATAQIEQEQQKILALGNSCFSTKQGPLKIIQLGEAEALALARVYGAHALFIDERTTRSLIENPSRLKQTLERRQDAEIFVDEENVLEFKGLFTGLRVFRSVDIIATAFEQNLFDGELEHGHLELEAALYAAKFAGCAVSEMEIELYLSGRK
jgi:predicted nucleic acid-binding protein